MPKSLIKTPSFKSWIDTHCHLFDQRFAEQKMTPAMIYHAAMTAHAQYLINVGTDLTSSQIVIKQAQQFPNCLPAVGIHPHEADKVDSQTIQALEMLIQTNRDKIVAIGEIGLDYHYNFATIARQKWLFKAQLKLAAKYQLPVLLHVRKAFADLKTILKPFALQGISHCFAGSLEDANWLIARGFKLALGGILTFPNAENLRTIVKMLPLSAFVLETDAPYLAPQSNRGKINYPHYLLETAQLVAKLKTSSLADVLWTTSQNACQLFKLSFPPFKNKL